LFTPRYIRMFFDALKKIVFLRLNCVLENAKLPHETKRDGSRITNNEWSPKVPQRQNSSGQKFRHRKKLKRSKTRISARNEGTLPFYLRRSPLHMYIFFVYSGILLGILIKLSESCPCSAIKTNSLQFVPDFLRHSKTRKCLSDLRRCFNNSAATFHLLQEKYFVFTVATGRRKSTTA
jgi:hypothetical protein